MKRSLLTGTVLFLSLLGVGSAKSWSIVVDSKASAGTLQLPKGDYHLKLDGNRATFTDNESGKKYSVDVTVKQAPQKFSDTAVENTKQGDMEVIQGIELGGTATELDFGE